MWLDGGYTDAGATTLSSIINMLEDLGWRYPRKTLWPSLKSTRGFLSYMELSWASVPCHAQDTLLTLAKFHSISNNLPAFQSVFSKLSSLDTFKALVSCLKKSYTCLLGWYTVKVKCKLMITQPARVHEKHELAVVDIVAVTKKNISLIVMSSHIEVSKQHN